MSRLSWEYEEDQIKVNTPKEKRVTHTTSNIEKMNFVPSPFIKPVCQLTTIKICPGKKKKIKKKNQSQL